MDKCLPRVLAILVVGLLISISATEGSSCQLPAGSLRQSIVIQNAHFDQAYALTLEEGLNCIREVTSPWGAVNQTLRAVSDFYEQFYAFRRICQDPPASVQSEVYPFGLGVFGSPQGGGTPGKAAKVDIVDGLRDLAESFPLDKPVSVADWYLPATSLFNRLRDAHVNWRNGRTKVDNVLNQFIFMLQDDTSKKAVKIEVSAATKPVVPDGTAETRFVYRGKVIKTIEGMAPMRWFQETLLENPAFNYPYKSVGARANHMLMLGQIGFAWLGSNMGDVSALKPKATVVFEDSSFLTWSWTFLLLTRNFPDCQLHDGSCYTRVLTATMETPSSLFSSAREAWELLSNSGRKASASETPMTNDALESPDAEMLSTLQQDASLRDLLGVAEEHVPGTEARLRLLMGSLPTDQTATARTWMLNPENSREHATYGFYQLKTDGDGKPYFVLKMTRFFLTDAESGGFEYIQGFVHFWKNLTSSAKSQGVQRLLVDLSGNSGGYVNFAYLFVRAMFPNLPFDKVCNEYDRPVGSLYKAWSRVNTKPLFAFLNDTAALERRAAALTNELAELVSVTRRLTKVGMALDILDYDEIMLLQEAIDALDIGDVDSTSLHDMISRLSKTSSSFGNPFAQSLEGFTAKGKAFDPYTTVVLKSRGGVNDVPFTAKFRVEDCAMVFTQEMIDSFDGVTNPFTEILFLTDGLCGSSCDTASRTVYLLSKQQLAAGKKAPRINYITYGGLGGSAAEAKTTLSATSFPGGNVMSNAMSFVYNPVIVASLFGFLAAEWAGLEDMKAALDKFRYEVPQYPYYWNKLPKYSQSEMYQNELGPKSLPAEYYFFPTDLYLPEWYSDVKGMPRHWNESELSRMHNDAAKAFSMEVNRLESSSGQHSMQVLIGSAPGSSASSGGFPLWAMLLAGAGSVVALLLACKSLNAVQILRGDGRKRGVENSLCDTEEGSDSQSD